MPEERHIPTLAELRELNTDPTQLEQAASEALQLHQRAMSQIHREAGNDGLTASQQRAWDVHERATQELERFETEQRLVRVTASRATYGAFRVDGSTPPAPRGGELLGLGRRSLDEQVRSKLVSDAAGERLTTVLDGRDIVQRDAMAEWLHVAGSPEYLSAFSRMVADPTHGHLSWTPAEHQAYRAVKDWSDKRTEMRTALATGGYVLPVSLDPVVIISNAGSISPLRMLADVKTTATDTYRKIKTTGATAEWKTEGSQAADGTPPAAEVEIPLFSAVCDAIWSYELQRSALDLVDQLARVMQDAILNQLNTAYATGNGSTAPQGIVTGLAGTSSEINTAGSETYHSTDPTVLQAALGARYSARAVWLSHIATKNAYAFMETTNGALLFPELRRDPAQLLGKRWYEVSNMDGSINAAATANNYVMIYGDVFAGYTIVDQVGASVEILPVFGSNGRPTAQRQMLSWSRHGAEVVDDLAMRLLDIPTTA